MDEYKVTRGREDVYIGYSQCSSSPTYQSHELSTEEKMASISPQYLLSKHHKSLTNQ